MEKLSQERGPSEAEFIYHVDRPFDGGDYSYAARQSEFIEHFSH